MAERTAISQGFALGVETTPGTPVAATRRLGSVGFTPGVKAEFGAQRPFGQKFKNAYPIGKEWSESSIEGSPVYTELPYLFASLYNTPTITPAGTGGYTWAFETDTFSADTPKTYTVEQGDAVRAHRAANVIIGALTMSFSRDEVSLEGSALGEAIEDGITLSGGATQLEQVLLLPRQVSVYLDDTAAGLGTTKLTRVLKGEVGLENRFGPLWTVDAAQASYAAVIETEPDGMASLTLEADAQGMALLETMRAGDTKFLRVEAVGPNIDVGVDHRLRWDCALQVNDVEPFGDEDGVFAIGWKFGYVHNGTWGKATSVEVVTTTSAL